MMLFLIKLNYFEAFFFFSIGPTEDVGERTKSVDRELVFLTLMCGVFQILKYRN